MPHSHRPRTLRFETLEDRSVPATATLWQGTLHVNGTVGSDIITVTEVGGRLSVAGTRIQFGAQRYVSVPAAWATRVYVTGGPGHDTINISPVTKPATIFGGVGNDTITGGLAVDEIFGRDGNDSILGGGGADRLFGELGDDFIRGDDGSDTLFAGAGHDTLDGREGNDLIYGETGDDVGSGGAGNDTVLGNVGNDRLDGGDGNDEVRGEDGDDTVAGDAGNDSVHGGTGRDTVTGGADADEVFGDPGNDSVDGGTGNDSIRGGAGDDRAAGGLGNDLIQGEDGTDTLHGDDGDDTMAGGAGADFVFGDAGNDYTTGGPLGDFVNGGPGNDTVSGTGDDVVDGGGGADTVIGGGGSDTGGDPGGPVGEPGGGSSTTGTVLQTIRALWMDGSTNDITVRNTGTTALNGWTVEFDADFEITEAWNAQLVSHVGDRYTFRNIPGHWATLIRPNTQVTFGFNARLAPGDLTGIRNIELNNVPLAADSGTGNGGTLPATGTATAAVRAAWVEGATLDMTVRNTGATPINGWTVSFEADFEVTEVWNAQLVGRVGDRYTIRNIPNHWAGTVRAGQQVTFGFNVRLGEGDGTEVRNVALNANNP